MARKVLVDFDRTLFDTGAFFTDFWDWASVEYGVDGAYETARVGDYTKIVSGEWRDYLFFEHIASIVAITDSSAGFRRRVQERFTSKYLFDDVSELRHVPYEIVTFGNGPYQEFKLSLCPELSSVARHITITPKGEYISSTFGDTSTVLIDDKDIHADLPASTKFILLDRKQPDPIRNLDTFYSVQSLRDAMAIAQSVD